MSMETPLRITMIIAALLVCLTIKGTFAKTCLNPVTCPCGIKGENVTVCAPASVHAVVCRRLSKCDSCKDGLNFCTKCPAGFGGSTCSREIRKKRQKRQSNSIAQSTGTSSCSDLQIPKFALMNCSSVGSEKFCTATCIRGAFLHGTDLKEMTLTCSGGVWTPRKSFPDCYFRGDCEFYEQKAGRSECQKSYHKLICDIWCNNRHMGEFRCFQNTWLTPLPLCVTPKIGTRYYNEYCDHPGRIPNAKLQYFAPESDSPEDYEVESVPEGSVVEYSCLGVFLLHGSHRLRCEKEKAWSKSPPTCVQVCGDPGFIENGQRRNTNGSESSWNEYYEEGQSVVYSCISNDTAAYALQGSSILTCKQDGQWSRPLPVCIRLATTRFCEDPGVDENGSRKPAAPSNPSGFQLGTKVNYACNRGFYLSGKRSIVCLKSGKWTASPPRCEEQGSNSADCSNPGIISNGEVMFYPTNGTRRALMPMDELKFPEGSRLQYSCYEGYMLLGKETLICEKSGSWSDEPPVCRIDTSLRKHCVDMGPVKNGQVKLIPAQKPRKRPDSTGDHEKYPAGSRLQYSCNEKYTLVGPKTLTCKWTGNWSPAEPPTCKNADYEMTCLNPGRVLNSKLYYFAPGVWNNDGEQLDTEWEDYPESSRLEYFCVDGFWLEGSQNRVCESTGFWSGMAPTCVPDCGRCYVLSEVRILNGQETVRGEWPWVVYISLEEEDNSARFVCGGAVFNTHAVVTAAHCLERDRTYVLRFGKHHFSVENDDSQVLVRRSSRIIIHPDYINGTLDSDIALILFDPPIHYSRRIQPICMPTLRTTLVNIVPGTVGYVSGWGVTEYDRESDSLLFSGLPVLSLQSCAESYERQNLSAPLTGNKFCAGYFNGTGSICEGDSGSPFVFYDNLSQRYTLEGLVSFVVRRRQDAQKCGLPGRFAIFTKVYRFVPWLHENAP